MKNVFRLVNPVYDIDQYTFKVDGITKPAKYEWNTVLCSSFRVFNM